MRSFLGLVLETSVSRNIRNFFSVVFFHSFELGKLLPEISEKYKARKLHLGKYKKVSLCQGSENTFPET